MALLEVDDISISFGGLSAVSDFSLKIENNELVGLIGPNGAGKTTVFNMLTGVYTPNSGSIHFDGKNITGAKPYKIAQSHISRTFQNIRLLKSLSVLENIMISFVYCENYSIISSFLRPPKFFSEEAKSEKKAKELLSVFDLLEKKDEKAGSLPYGEQRLLEMARALAANPKLLLLDEPAAGMNPKETKELTELILKIRKDFKVAILLIEHDMPLVMGICEKIAVLDYGKKIAEGTPKKIKSNKKVIEAYLGEGE